MELEAAIGGNLEVTLAAVNCVHPMHMTVTGPEGWGDGCHNHINGEHSDVGRDV